MEPMCVGVVIGVPLSAVVIGIIVGIGWLRWKRYGFDHTFRQYFRIMWLNDLRDL